MCRINPRVDFAFKKLFGSEENTEILIDFINSIVSEKDKVTEIELKNPTGKRETSACPSIGLFMFIPFHTTAVCSALEPLMDKDEIFPGPYDLTKHAFC